jgi:GTP-binding protein Era
VPVSARTGDGLDALVAELEARLPGARTTTPTASCSDQPESFLAAELLREKLLACA